MKVLHVTLSFSHGGRREAIASLCDGLTRLGVENYLCCLDSLGGEVPREHLFAEVLELRRERLPDFGAMRRLRHFCRRHGIDVVHSHDAASQASCAMALWGRKLPLLMSFHRSRNFEAARVRDRLRNALAGLRTDAIVAASEERRRHYRSVNHVPARKVLRIPLGIDLQRFQPDCARRPVVRADLGLPRDRLLVGVVGHFGPEKGVDLAIEAFQRMCRRHPRIDADLVVLGTGSAERVAFVAGCIDPVLAARIHLAGFQAQSSRWTCGFDVLLHAPRIEAFGLVLIEAMACAVPVVAPATGGISDIVRDGATGRLVARPDPDLLAAALAELLLDPAERARMAHGALQRARDEYGVERYAGDFQRLYQRLLAARNP